MPLVLSALSLGLCLFFFFFFRRYIAKKTSAARLLEDYRTEINRFIAEVDAATDRDLLLVEERVKTLRQLLEDTDRRIGVYMRELERSRRGEAMYASLGRGIRAALDPSRPETLVGEGLSSASPQPPEEPAPAAKERPAEKKRPGRNRSGLSRTKPPEERSSDRNKTENRTLKVQIAEMSARGLSPAETASRLNLSLAEVELALNLLYAKGNSGEN